MIVHLYLVAALFSALHSKQGAVDGALRCRQSSEYDVDFDASVCLGALTSSESGFEKNFVRTYL